MKEKLCFSKGGVFMNLNAEQLAQLLDGIFRILHRVPFHVRMGKNFKIISALKCLVAEEVHLVVLLQVLQAERLVPA